MSKLNISDLKKEALEGKKVLVRVDFNVPLKDGKISDDTRIVAALPTIKYLLDNHAIVILTSHLGRPKAREEKYSLKPIADYINEKTGLKVDFLTDEIDSALATKIAGYANGGLILLENIRYYPEEEKNNREFAEKLSKLADLYVNDAFGTAHRAHASTAGVAEFLPAYAGFLMKKEIDFLSKALHPEKPFVAIIGGAKISTKIGVLKNLIEKTDSLIIGGAMTYTFLKAQGIGIGKSLVEDEFLETAKEVMLKAKEVNCNLILAEDHIVTESLDSDTGIAVDEIADNMIGVDIGEKTLAKIKAVLATAKTIVWNGPMGVFEKPAFAKGTKSVAEFMAEATTNVAITVVGGGDSVAAIEQLGLGDKFSHISTGGGASLEFLEGIDLPGIKVIKNVE